MSRNQLLGIRVLQLLLPLGHTRRVFFSEILKNKSFSTFSGIWFFFANTGAYIWSKNFKTLLLPQITFDSFQTFSDFASQLSSQKSCFWVFEYTICFSFLLTWEPMGTKRYSSHKSLLKFSKLLLNFLLSGPHKSTVVYVLSFLTFFLNWTFTIVSYGETKTDR